jgi:hypothetical protein
MSDCVWGSLPFLRHTSGEGYARLCSLCREKQGGGMTTTEHLQAQMRRGPEGSIICERCGGQVRSGWCYGFGAIVLATCAKPACQPKDPYWVKSVLFR